MDVQTLSDFVVGEENGSNIQELGNLKGNFVFQDWNMSLILKMPQEQI